MSYQHGAYRDPRFMEELRAQIWRALEDELDKDDLAKQAKGLGVEPKLEESLHAGNSETERQLELLFSDVRSKG